MMGNVGDTVSVAKGVADQIQRMVVSDLGTLYGCCRLFDSQAENALVGLTMDGVSPLLDWLQWLPSQTCEAHKAFLNWVRPEYSEGVATEGYLADACADPHGVEFGVCDWRISDFARLRRWSPVRDRTYNQVSVYESAPRARLNGEVITNQTELDILLATEALVQDLKRMTVTGNGAVPGQMNGLNSIIHTGYTDTQGHRCSSMDSIVIDWAGNDMGGGTGITWNGNPVPDTLSLVDILRNVVRRIRWRISLSPPMAAQRLRAGDIVIVGPSWLLEGLLDRYTCWSVCTSTVFANKEAIDFRNQAASGGFGFGQIALDGFPVPLIPHDWGTTVGPTRGDLYVLTRGVGGLRSLYGEYLDMRTAQERGQFVATDGGRLLTWSVWEHTCLRYVVEMRPRIIAFAPWSLARIQSVAYATPGGAYSPDPTETSFFPETSFSAATCP